VLHILRVLEVLGSFPFLTFHFMTFSQQRPFLYPLVFHKYSMHISNTFIITYTCIDFITNYHLYSIKMLMLLNMKETHA
jgi:hypothetical protein